MRETLSKVALKALGCRDGMAATEFALILPALVILFFGMLETSDAMTANRRVAMAVNSAADLAAQSQQLTPDEVDALFDGVMTILEPADTTPVEIDLVSVVFDAGQNRPEVHWSRDKAGNEPYVAGTEFTLLGDNNVLDQNGSLIFVEVNYPYTPSFTQYFVSNPIVFDRTAIRWPRLVTRVQLCDNQGNNCTQ